MRFELHNNHIYLPVRVNGMGPFNFLLDTGASASAIDRERAEALGIPFVASDEAGQGPGSGPFEVAFASGVTLGLDETAFSPEQLAVVPFDFAHGLEGRAIDGLLGHDFLQQHVVSIDFIAGKIVLEEPQSYLYQGEGESLPLNWWNNLPLVNAAFRARGGVSVCGRYIVDLGASASVALTRPFSASHHLFDAMALIEQPPVAELGGESRFSVGRIAQFRIGCYQFEDLIIGLSHNREGVFSLDQIAGVIGSEVWRRFHVIFDYAHRRLIVEPNERWSEPIEFDMSGLMLTTEGGAFVVAGVLRPSPAASAGFAVGERIMRIDGRAAASLSLDDVREWFKHSGRAFQLSVAGTDGERTVELVTERLI